MSNVLGLWAKEAQLEDLRRRAELSRRTRGVAKTRPTRRGTWSRIVGFALVDVGLRLASGQPEPVAVPRVPSAPAGRAGGGTAARRRHGGA